MPIPDPSCIVALPRERNRATSAEGATSDATPETETARKPASILELRMQLRAQLTRNQQGMQGSGEKPELHSDPAAEARRRRVLTMLAENSNIRRAVLVDNAHTDPVLVAVGIRGVATFELAIPAARFDAFKLLDLIERHGDITVH